ncbi:MAG: 50S ribosomal protein L15 [Desulfobacteraceae bacterium]|nr:50S ribosomal protein L15 [Desulfobacteraceae bacterium]
MITLNDLRPHVGARKVKKRVGRGEASGHGKTSCKGEKGQRARTGASIGPGFEGGQMPLYRQLPKRGFKNSFKKLYGILNLRDISVMEGDAVVDINILKEKGLVHKRFNLLKILGDGEIGGPVVVKAHAASKEAVKKIEAAGGRVEFLSRQGNEA